MNQTLSKSGFFQHPMNHLMLEESGLPQYMPQELAGKYINLVKSGHLPTDSQVQAVHNRIIKYCRKVHGDDAAALQADVDGLNETWPIMRERFAKNLGLTQLMLDYGVNSRYFYQYLYITGIKFYGLALVAKDGWMVPVSAGKMENAILEKVPRDDWMTIVNVEEPSHAGRRVTDGAVQSLLRKSKKIFDGGCGLASAYWNYGYPLGQLGQEITLCDQDKRLLPYLLKVFGCASLEELKERFGITVVFGDLLDVMARPEYAGQFDVVRLTGLLSYQPPEKKQKIIELTARMLAPGGVIIADEWLFGLSLMRTAVTTLWPIDPNDPYRLQPAPNAGGAVAVMDAICKPLCLPYVYVPDFCNGNPVCWTQQRATPKCVVFLIGKGASADMLDLIEGALEPVTVA